MLAQMPLVFRQNAVQLRKSTSLRFVISGNSYPSVGLARSCLLSASVMCYYFF